MQLGDSLRRNAGNLALAGSAVLLSVIYLVGTYRIRDIEIVDPLGPKAFPALLGVGMLLCGGILGISTLVNVFASDDGGSAEDERSHPVAIAAVAAWLLAYYMVFEPLGFLISTAVFIFGLTAFFNRGHWVLNVLVSIGFPLALNLIFDYLLGRSPAPGLLSF